MAHVILRHEPSDESAVVFSNKDGVYEFAYQSVTIRVDPVEWFKAEEVVLVFGPMSPNENKSLVTYGGREHMAQVLRTSLVDSTPVAAIYFDATPAEHVMVVVSPVNTDLPHEIETGNVQAFDIFARFYPSANRMAAKRGLKGGLLAETNITDSLVALEQQVDLLSVLVISYLDELSADQRPVWYDTFKAAVEVSGTEVVRSAMDNAAGMAMHKARIRALQADYFAAKARL